MLYPKGQQPFDIELFQNPTSEYRGTPFWAWNCKLDQGELLRQIDVLRQMGFGGFHMHVRTGMATNYLSDDYMSLVRACVEKAKSSGMLAWLYDEDRWPSGAAGGIVTHNTENRMKRLRLTRQPSGADPLRTFVRCYDVQLNKDGTLASYASISETDEARGIKLYAYLECDRDNPWFNNQAYADTLSPSVIREFIEATYERYGGEFADDFGGAIPAIFTDEPQFAEKTTLHYASDAMDVRLPWTRDLPDTFKRAYPDLDLLNGVPELVWEPQQGVSRVRYCYHDHIAERFAQAFADQCGNWCARHGLMLTGHMMQEPTLESQTGSLGDTMRSYRGFQLPGIDMLCNRYEYTTAKQAQSASHQYGAPGVLSELYGVTNWDFDFRSHKIQGDWQAALGVTVRVPHLSWVSMNGEAKRDYPGTFNYQAPWHDQYKVVEDHFSRVNVAMTRGKPIVRIGVIHPVESYWLHWGPKENTRAVREELDAAFEHITEWLLCDMLDFDFIAESLLPDQCALEELGGGQFAVGQMRYDAVIVPNCETLRSSTLERLERFRDAGGRILFMGRTPRYEDALPSERGAKLCARSECIGMERIALSEALHDLRMVEVRDETGARTTDLFYQLREDVDGRFLFISHAREPKNKDLTRGRALRISVQGKWALAVLDTQSGTQIPIESSFQSGWSAIAYPFFDHDSLLLRLTKAPLGAERKPPKLAVSANSIGPGSGIARGRGPETARFLDCVPVMLEEPNVLLLDMAEYRLNDDPYRPMEEILRLDNELRRELGWPLRMEAVAQPWVETDESMPYMVTLRFGFRSDMDIRNAKLALERPDLAAICLNGKVVPVKTDGYYVDKCIHTVPLPAIAVGENTLEVSYRYGRKVDLEAMYLIGDFGVSIAGCRARLTAPVRTLAFGDITRQGLPFYGGNIVYHVEVNCAGPDVTIEASCYRGQMISVNVDGRDAGHILYSPYRLNVPNVGAGPHKIDLCFYGNRVNTFGQLHCNNREPGLWWGPNSWRTSEAEWTYEYLFWRQGILKSPEIY